MKVESRENKSHKFNTKVVREILTQESKFISQLWDKVVFPSAVNNDEDYLFNTSGDGDVLGKRKAEFLLTHHKGAPRAKSFEELHDKLQAMKGKKLAYKEKLLKKGLKNRIVKKRKKDEHKLKKTLIKVGSNFVPHTDIKLKPQKPIYNSEGKMVFSKFDFSESGIKTKTVGKKEKEEKDPHKILKKLEKQKGRLKELEKEGELQKVTEIREKIAWDRALNKAEGIKVKDNPELLKKTIKKEMKRKHKSKKKWEARVEGVKNRQEERQKKRMGNIQARKKQVKLNKMKKAAKKGRIIPGF